MSNDSLPLGIENRFPFEIYHSIRKGKSPSNLAKLQCAGKSSKMFEIGTLTLIQYPLDQICHE